jgi:hypothetical protein
MWQFIGQLSKVDLWISSKNRPIVDLRRWVCKGVFMCVYSCVYMCVSFMRVYFCVHSCVCIFLFIHVCVFLGSFMRVYMCKATQESGGSRKVDYTSMWEEGV